MSIEKEILDFLANKNLCFFVLNQLNTKARCQRMMLINGLKMNIDPFVVIRTFKNKLYVLHYDKWVINKKNVQDTC